MFGFNSQIAEVEADDLKKALDEKSENVILDVRTPGEYERGNIKGSINLPVDEVAAKVEKIIPDKDKIIYAYCLSGSRSTQAVEAIMKLGYKNVYSMKSGLLAWRAKHYPLENEK